MQHRHHGHGEWSGMAASVLAGALLTAMLSAFIPESARLDGASRCLMVAGFFCYLMLLPAFREDIPIPGRARRALERHVWLRWADRFGWCVLGASCIALIWQATAVWPVVWSRALVSAVGGCLLTRLLARLGWGCWSAAFSQPGSEGSEGSALPGRDLPFLSGGLRAPIVPTLAQRAGAFLLGQIVPGVGLAAACLAPWPLSGLEGSWSARAGLALALVLYGVVSRSRRIGFFREQLEWVPGTGLLLLHSRPWDRSEVTVLGNRADLQEVKVVDGLAVLTFPGRTLRVPSGELSEGLCAGTRKPQLRGVPFLLLKF